MNARAFSFLAAAAMLACSGCQAPSSSQANSPLFSSGASSASRTNRTPGSPWTILCIELTGPAAKQQCEEIARSLKATKGIRPDEVRVVDEPDGPARVYYGTYWRKTEPNSRQLSMPKNLRVDLDLIHNLGGQMQERFFAFARMVRTPTPNAGNPEWDLTKVEGAYSLQIAAFEPSDDFWDFKAAAAEYCDWLRKQGHPAYYHHGESSSIVTVGQFPETAVVPIAGSLPRYSAEVADLQQNELFRYNVLNGAVVRAHGVSIGGAENFDARPEKNRPRSQSALIPSRLVPIPRRGSDLTHAQGAVVVQPKRIDH